MSASHVYRIVIAVCLLAANFPLRVYAADETAAGLLAKHASYAGWRGGDGSAKTLRLSGDATRDGKVVNQLTRLQMGPVYRSSSTWAAGSFENGFTGRVFWQSNVNGFTTQTVGDVAKFLATRIQVSDEELTALPAPSAGTRPSTPFARRLCASSRRPVSRSTSTSIPTAERSNG